MRIDSRTRHSAAWLVGLVSVLPSLLSAAAPLTHAPFTYEIDYRQDQARDKAFQERFDKTVPDLFHPGADLRYLGRFGIGGMVLDSRQQPYGEYLREVRAYTEFLHARGVRWITPYLCNQTVTGNSETRLGAWDLWDRWDEFAFLGLGERPPEPLKWMQREPSGNLHYNYKRMCFLSRGFSAEQVRYAPCPNNPHWRRLCNNEARLTAGMGFDGLFVDNCILHCYCAHCEAHFQNYLQRKYTPVALQEAFGANSYGSIGLYKEGDVRYWARTFDEFIPWLEARHTPEERRIYFDTTGSLDALHVDNAGGGMLIGETTAFIRDTVLSPGTRFSFEAPRLANPALQSPAGRLRWADTMMFWAESIGEMLEEMRNAGQQEDPDFFLIPNWGTMLRVNAAAGRAEDAKDMRRWVRGATWHMYEEAHTTGLVAPGVVLDYDMELRFAFANGVRAMLLPYKMGGPALEEIALAETAASGGSVFVSTQQYPEVQNRYQRFYRENAALYEGYESTARVALAFLFDQVHYLNLDHMRAVHALNRCLADQQILFDHIIEPDLDPQRLARYAAVVLPVAAYLSNDEVTALQIFVMEGGTLITIGATATHDTYCRPGSAPPEFAGPGAKGRVVHFESLAAALPHDGIYLEEGLQAVREGGFGKDLDVGSEDRYAQLAFLNERLWFKRYQEPGPLTPIIAEALGEAPSQMDPRKASGMRTHAYRKNDGGSTRLVMHLVNKNVPLGAPEEDRRVRPVTNLKVRLPLPAGAKLTGPVRILAPGQTTREVEPTVENGTTVLTLDQAGAYTLLAAEYEEGSL